MQPPAAKRRRTDASAGSEEAKYSSASVSLTGLPSPVIAVSVSFLTVQDHLRAASTCKALLAACQMGVSWHDLVDFSRSMRAPNPGWAGTYHCHPVHLAFPLAILPFAGQAESVGCAFLLSFRPRSLRLCQVSHPEMAVPSAVWSASTQNFSGLESLDYEGNTAVFSLSGAFLPALTELRVAQHFVPFEWRRQGMPALQRLHITLNNAELDASVRPVLHSLSLLVAAQLSALLLPLALCDRLRELEVCFHHDDVLQRTVAVMAASAVSLPAVHLTLRNTADASREPHGVRTLALLSPRVKALTLRSLVIPANSCGALLDLLAENSKHSDSGHGTVSGAAAAASPVADDKRTPSQQVSPQPRAWLTLDSCAVLLRDADKGGSKEPQELERRRVAAVSALRSENARDGDGDAFDALFGGCQFVWSQPPAPWEVLSWQLML